MYFLYSLENIESHLFKVRIFVFLRFFIRFYQSFIVSKKRLLIKIKITPNPYF